MDSCFRLIRRGAGRNMAWFYRLEIALELFEGAVLVQLWGRIGSRGQQRRDWCQDAGRAGQAVAM